MSQSSHSLKGVEQDRQFQGGVGTTIPNTSVTDTSGETFEQRSFRQRFYDGLHAGLRAKLARAQYVLWKDPEGYQRGDSLSALNKAVSDFLKEAPLGRGARAFAAQVEDGQPRTTSGDRVVTSGRRRRRSRAATSGVEGK